MEVLVIGGANIDIKAKCVGAHVTATSNIAQISSKSGGVARNIAHNLARLGAKVGLLSVVGDDENGRGLLAATVAAGVDVSLCLTTLATTGSYLAFLDSRGELITAANDMSILQAITPRVIEAQAEKIANAKYVLADCNLEQATLKAISKIAAHKLIIEPVSVEKSKRVLGLSAFLATPNLDQVFAMTGTNETHSAAKTLHKSGVQNLIIHMGKAGAAVSDGKEFITISSGATNIVDVTGAGDAATAGAIFGLVKGWSLVKAAKLGQEQAAKVLASTSSTLD